MPFDLKQTGGMAAKMALAFLAAKQAGPQAAAAFLQGIQHQQTALDAQAKQDTQQQFLNDRLLRQDTQAAENQRLTQADRVADNQRQADEFRVRQMSAASGALDSYGQTFSDPASTADPVQAENAMMSRGTALSSAFGLAPDALSGFVPNMTPIVTARQKKQAKDLYDRAEKRYNAKGENPDWETSITLQTGEQFGDVTPAKLRALFEAPAVDASGAPAKPSGPVTAPRYDAKQQTVIDAFVEKNGRQPSAQEKVELLRQAETLNDVPKPPPDPSIGAMRDLQLELAQQRLADLKKPKEPKEPNQAQFTAAGYAGRIEQAEPILTAVTPAIVAMSLPAFELQTNSWFARPTFQSSDVQSYMQASRNFINAVLRRESGAVISPSEFAEARKQYLPVVGDDPKALQQKAANRAYVFSTLRRSAGSAYEPPPAPTAPPTVKGDPMGIR